MSATNPASRLIMNMNMNHGVEIASPGGLVSNPLHLQRLACRHVSACESLKKTKQVQTTPPQLKPLHPRPLLATAAHKLECLDDPCWFQLPLFGLLWTAAREAWCT